MPKTYGNVNIRFSLAVDLILAFDSGPNVVREVKNMSPNFKQIPHDILRY